MEPSEPTAAFPGLWSYLSSSSFVQDCTEVVYVTKKTISNAWQKLYYTRYERRLMAAQNKDRPELSRSGWSPLDLASTFKLPPLDDKMPRVDGTTLSVDEFRRKYEEPRIPCIITGLTDNWKAHQNWSIYNLRKNYADVLFKCGESPDAKRVHLKMKYYADYLVSNKDDSPLYIFDGKFGEKAESMLLDYEVPSIFQQNLFDVLGAHKKRPLYRWIVIGPARSGTTIHIDPHGTSAWNALIHGHKRWVFIHPDTPRELVHIPKDQRGVHPKEAVTWFSTVYKRIRDGDWPFEKYPVLECRQNPGETLFVPCGWWHVVMNEDATVAVTQNFCSPVNLHYVYPTILQRRPKLAQLFIERLGEEHPELLKELFDSMKDPKPISNGYTTSDDESTDEDDDSESTITPDSTEESYYESEDEEDSEESEESEEGEKLDKKAGGDAGVADEGPCEPSEETESEDSSVEREEEEEEEEEGDDYDDGEEEEDYKGSVLLEDYETKMATASAPSGLKRRAGKSSD